MMRLKAAEYFMDSPDKAYPLYPVDGSFDSQLEVVNAEIDTAGLKPGTHIIYVRAMERNNKWGEPASLPLVIKEKESSAPWTRWSAIAGVFASIFSAITMYVSKKKSNRKKLDLISR